MSTADFFRRHFSSYRAELRHIVDAKIKLLLFQKKDNPTCNYEHSLQHLLAWRANLEG